MPKIHLLHLEDDPDHIRRVQSYLEREEIPCTVTVCAERAAFTTALEMGGIHGILASSGVEGLSGLEALAACQSSSPPVPFIFVRPRTGEETVIEAFSAGADGFILMHDLKQLRPLLDKIADGSLRKRRREDRNHALRLKRAEQERDRQEELLRTIFDRVPVMITIYDPHLRKFRFNRELTQVLGWSEADATTDFMEKVYPDPEYRREVVRYMQSLEPGWKDLMITTKDGTRIPTSWANFRLSDNRLVGIGIDIRERKRTEEELRRSETLYRTMAANLPNGAVFLVDRNLRYIIAEGPALAAAGLQKEDLEGKTLREAFEDETAGQHEALYLRALSGVSFRLEHTENGRHYLSEGVPVRDGDGEVIAVLATSYDITERIVAEEALREREGLLHFVTASSPDTIFIQDCDLRYVWAKPSPPMTLEDYLGQTDFDILAPEDAEYLSRVKQRVIADEQPVCIDVPLTLKGNSLFVEAAFEPWRDGSGNVIGIAGYVHDITERKRAEDDLRDSHLLLEQKVRQRTEELARTIDALQKEIIERQRAEVALKMEMQDRMRAVENLRQNERLLIQQGRQAAMGEMISNIAHQWRQPLNTLGLLIQGLQLNYDLGEFDRLYLTETVERSMKLIQHMSQTIDDFRNFFKPNKEKAYFSLAETVDKTLSLVENAFTHQGIMIRTVVAGDAEVTGYSNELSQAFLNILNNARDAFLERKVKNPEIVITVDTAEDKAVVTIEDNAGGIPDPVMEKLFNPYFTTKGHRGTGLGLFMSKTIVEKNMDGSLTARNTGAGACFAIECRTA